MITSLPRRVLLPYRTGADRWLVFLLALVWITALCGGFTSLLSYEQKPGPTSHLTHSWPGASSAHPVPGKYNLVIFVHPQCPCTRASLTEVARLVARCPDLKTFAFFLQPLSEKGSWHKSDLWDKACNIPGMTVLTDEGGFESRLFGTHTSGEVLLFDPRNQLVFSGGITGARSHEGDNQGLDALRLLITTGHSPCISTPVFGCSLDDDPSLR